MTLFVSVSLCLLAALAAAQQGSNTSAPGVPSNTECTLDDAMAFSTCGTTFNTCLMGQTTIAAICPCYTTCVEKKRSENVVDRR